MWERATLIAFLFQSSRHFKEPEGFHATFKIFRVTRASLFSAAFATKAPLLRV